MEISKDQVYIKCIYYISNINQYINDICIFTCNLKRLRICIPFEKDRFLNEKTTFSYPGTYFQKGTYFGGILIKKFWIHHFVQHSFSFSMCFSSTYLQNTIWFLLSSNSLGSCPTHLHSLFHRQAVFSINAELMICVTTRLEPQQRREAGLATLKVLSSYMSILPFKDINVILYALVVSHCYLELHNIRRHFWELLHSLSPIFSTSSWDSLLFSAYCSACLPACALLPH